MAAVTVCDRYYAICHPLQARHVHTVRRAVRLVAVFWIISLIVVSPQLAIQRLEPLIAFQKVTGSDRPRLRIVQSCAEFFHAIILLREHFNCRRLAGISTCFYGHSQLFFYCHLHLHCPL